MFNLRGLFLALIVALVATATTSAALSTLTMQREIELGLTNDSGETAVVRITNISDYSDDFMVEDADGVVSFALSEVISQGDYAFNRDAQYTLADNDGSALFQIDNNSDVPVYVYITGDTGNIELVGSDLIAAGGNATYYFTLDASGVSSDTLGASLHVTTTNPLG